MQDNIYNRNEPDDFSKIVRQKLENHQMPGDVPDWSAIEKRLKPKRKIMPWWMWLPIGSAAVLALLFTLRPLTESPAYIGKSEQQNFQKTEIETNKDKTHQVNKVLSSTKAEKKLIEIRQYNSSKTKAEVDESESGLAPTLQTEVVESKDNLIRTSNSDLPEKENIAQVVPENENDQLSDSPKEKFPDSQTEEPDNIPVSKQKNKKNWLLAAAFGTGGTGAGSSLGNRDMLYDEGNKNLVSAATDYSSILTPNDFTDIVHHAPVSFGIVGRKNLGNDMSIESGLVYTYLFSTFEKQGLQHSDAKLHLHYVGVPLNLIIQVLTKPKWEIYFSAGGMVEKGVRSIYIQNQDWGNQVMTTRAETKIDGFQWSLNSAFGASYKLQRNLGIYFEPKISYYLENNQPMSARTQQPFTVGLNAGLRYEF